MGVGSEERFTGKSKALKVYLMAYAVSCTGVYCSDSISYRSQIFMVIGILESDLDCITWTVL